MNLKAFHYDLPEELIAKYPCDRRDESRLLLLDKTTGKTTHTIFKDMATLFNKGDVLVFNNSRVFPCRLITKRKGGGKQEIFLVRKVEDKTRRSWIVNRGSSINNIAIIKRHTSDTTSNQFANQISKNTDVPLTVRSAIHDSRSTIHEFWTILINVSRKVREGDVFDFDDFTITICDSAGAERLALIEFEGKLMPLLEKHATVPLPPYLNRVADETDRTRYQTIYASQNGSTAAPTAGLHFTPELMDTLKERGVIMANVTLHVGPGTFLPVRVDNIENHKMHSEWFSLSDQASQIINQAKKEGRRVTAVGTTTTRVLESLGLPLRPATDNTNIFIYPPHTFKVVDRLITNFHLPESTLLMLVSAFANREMILNTYREAIEKKYRLFSYGDAMMIS